MGKSDSQSKEGKDKKQMGGRNKGGKERRNEECREGRKDGQEAWKEEKTGREEGNKE